MPAYVLSPETAARLKQLLGKDTTPPPPTRRRGGGGESSPHGFTIHGKLDGSLSAGGSATLSIWAWNGTAEADTGENVTVYDWLLSGSFTLASGAQVTAGWDRRSGRYYVTGGSCT